MLGDSTAPRTAATMTGTMAMAMSQGFGFMNRKVSSRPPRRGSSCTMTGNSLRQGTARGYAEDRDARKAVYEAR